MAGVTLERTGEAASSQVGLSGVLFGATVLALATSLPEISTGLQAIRQGDDNLAISDIFLTALSMLLTLVYVVGLIFRPRRRVAGMGVDSLSVVVLYLVGVGGLIAIAR